jgi:hypothetical protein
MWAGAYGDTTGYVWAASEDDAFEVWVEWLDEHAPGLLVSEFSDLLDEQARALGYASWPQLRDSDSRMRDHAIEAAECDLTPIGHCTMKSGHYICSWEWGLDEVDPDSDEYRTAYANSLHEVLMADVDTIAEYIRDYGCGFTWLGVNQDGSWDVAGTMTDAARRRWCAYLEVEAPEQGYDACGPEPVTQDWTTLAQELVDLVCNQVEQGK